jgi:hypothetical protein
MFIQRTGATSAEMEYRRIPQYAKLDEVTGSTTSVKATMSLASVLTRAGWLWSHVVLKALFSLSNGQRLTSARALRTSFRVISGRSEIRQGEQAGRLRQAADRSSPVKAEIKVVEDGQISHSRIRRGRKGK